MATRQYIGARYVPKFYEGGAWTANTAYEALTIVTRNGNSYTSKKPVPASVGAPENNPEYWVSTGIYNAQVQELSTQISENAAAISENAQAITTLEDGRALKRRFVLIGDSYGRGVVGPGESNVNGWTYYFKNILGLSDSDCIISCADGAGFIGLQSTTFLDLLNSAGAAATDPDTITDVIVAGGRNEIGADVTTINNAKSAFYNRAKTLFPNAQCSICFCGQYRGRNNNYTDQLQQIKAAYYSDLRWRFLKQAATFLGLWPAIWGTDETHFNQEGYVSLGRWIAQAAYGANPVALKGYTTANITPVEGYSLGTPNLQYRVVDEITEFYFSDGWSITFPSGNPPAAGTAFKVGDIADPILGGSGSSTCSFPVVWNIYFPGTGFVQAMGVLRIRNKEVNVSINAGNPNGSGFLPMTGASSMSMQGGMRSLPSWSIFG